MWTGQVNLFHGGYCPRNAIILPVDPDGSGLVRTQTHPIFINTQVITKKLPNLPKVLLKPHPYQRFPFGKSWIRL